MQHQPPKTPREILERLTLIEQKLTDLGISPEKASETLLYVDEYRNSKEALIKGRDQQFHADAYELGRRMSAASNKNVALLSSHLRQFAEHVTSHVLSLTRQEASAHSVTDLVDHIPLLFQSEDA